MLKIDTLLLGAVAALTLFSCNSSTAVKPQNSPTMLHDKVITLAEQKQLTPDSVVAMLKTGNENFYKNKLTLRNDSLRIHLTASGQYPIAAILACSDSRIPVEEVFDKGIGDLFVNRIAGNVADTEILGSLEYACKVSGVKAIMVLGHEHCGTAKAAIDNVKDGNMTALISEIRPAVNAVNIKGDNTSKNDSLVHDVVEKNVELTMKRSLPRVSLLSR
ncbi:MAG: carbonic anhydrase [Mucilaginibacter sp.]|uniref:carbonic anhydrase n=1 Tax=Mucilaginibacter sp. TaxID=1882438 RepID=UPI0031B5154F